MRRFLIGAVALLGLGAIAAYAYHGTLVPWMYAAREAPTSRIPDALSVWIVGKSDADVILVSGNIEAHESILSFKSVQSRIVELPFDEGQTVAVGTVIARVDDSDYKQQVAIAEAAVNERVHQLDVAEQNVAATRRTIVSDQAEVSLRQLQFDRAQTLFTKGAGTTDARDARPRQRARDRGRRYVALAIAAITNRAGPSRSRENHARLHHAERAVRRRHPGAPGRTRRGRLARRGNHHAGRHQSRLASRLRQRARHRQDSARRGRHRHDKFLSRQAYPGRISFISEPAEFTPKSVETHAERVTLVYRIRIDIDNPTHELVPGLPADARIAVKAPGQS